MTKQFLTDPRRPFFLPRKQSTFISFMATSTLVTSMLAASIPVWRHPYQPDQYITPKNSLSPNKFWDLLNDDRFRFIATVQFLVSPTGSNQPYAVPGTWNSGNN